VNKLFLVYIKYWCGRLLLDCLLLVQGGIYTLPSHLSPGARDLIPRMLLVDPMKRVTIPEIRQHTWFLNHLPRYLAVPPPDTTQQAKRVRVLHDSQFDVLWFCNLQCLSWVCLSFLHPEDFLL
jgi:serine/threonine protein kinase